MSAYGFEENYAKAWPEGAAPGKGTRRVHDCGKLNFAGEGTKEKRFEIEPVTVTFWRYLRERFWTKNRTF